MRNNGNCFLSPTEVDLNFSTFQIITFQQLMFHAHYGSELYFSNCDLLLFLCLTFFRPEKVLIVCSIKWWNNTSGDFSGKKSRSNLFLFVLFSHINVSSLIGSNRHEKMTFCSQIGAQTKSWLGQIVLKNAEYCNGCKFGE